MTNRRVVVAICLGSVVLAGGAILGVALTPVAAGTAGSGPIPQQTAQPPVAAVQESVDADVVVMRARIQEDGTASWSVAFRTRLDDENATTAFESLQADVAANSSAYTDRFETGMARTVRSAENATGREMRLANVTVDATTEQLGQEYGVVTYRFRWTNFAAVDGNRIRAGDALSGLFLDSETSLVLAWPDGYETDAVSPAPDERREGEVVWHGRLDFGPDQPRVVLTPTGGIGTTVLAVGALVLAALGVTGWLVRSRTREDETAAPSPADTGTETGPPDDQERDGDGAEAAVAEPPEELLSNEERVLRLLEEEGGRIKQQRIAEEFDWTDAKTSQVVGSLRDEDAVETFRIGRENVVTLPEHSDL